jgi:hypothetical protein
MAATMVSTSLAALMDWSLHPARGPEAASSASGQVTNTMFVRSDRI